MRSRMVQPNFRPRRPQDDPFVVQIGRRVFGRWSRDPAYALVAMLQQPRAHAELAWVDAGRVGFFILGLDVVPRPFGPWQRPVVARLDAIAVVPGAQRRGLGRALLERAEQAAVERGAVVMSLMTATENAPARQLFADAGFLELTELPNRYANGDGAIELFKALDAG